MEKKTIGSFIAVLRKSIGMTQQEVADRLNVSNKTISKWERDESYPEITLIPVLAEIFGVTSDEILRGERITANGLNAEKGKEKADKQIKRLLNSSIAKFKNVSFIALALVFVGLISLFTISYSTPHRPVIGFGVFLIFVVSSVILETIQFTLIGSTLRDNELLEENDQLLSPLLLTKYRYAFVVYCSNIIAVIFALPFILVRDSYYAHSVITLKAYLTWTPTLIVISAVLIITAYHLNKEKLLLQTGNKVGNYGAIDGMSKLNRKQGRLILIAISMGIIGLLSSLWGSPLLHSISLMVFYVVVFVLLITLFTIPAKSKVRKERILLFAAGARNLAYGFSILLGLGGISYWKLATGEVGVYYRYDYLRGMTWIIIIVTGLYALTRHIVWKRIKQG